MTNLANAFFRQGFEVNILSVKQGTMEKELDCGVNFKHYNKRYGRAFTAFYKHVKQKEPNIVFTSQHGASALSYIICKLSKFTGMRIVREPDSNFRYYNDQKKILIRGILKYLIKKSYQNADAVVVHSQATTKSLVESNIINANAKNIVEIPNPIDMDRIYEESLDNTLFDSIKLPEGDYIIYVGRLIHHKNIDKVIRAIPLLSDQISLVIVGSGPEEVKLKKLVNNLKIDDHVFFTGQLTNPYPILKNAKLLVSIGEWEGFGMVVLEALCLNVPTLTLDNEQGPARIIHDGKYGFLTPDYTPNSLARHIKRALTSTLPAEQLISRAQEYEASKIVKFYLKLFNTSRA